ncbi:MAG: SDR family oxidoreductase [Leptospiraceae bacterium]|nr:SDR family oxidoreductase [Leptospiraceae bacterium]
MMNQTVLITGATSGIGFATALSLAELGWTVIIHGRKEETCKKSVKEIKSKTLNKNIHYISADLSDLTSVNKMSDSIRENHPNLNVLINNAGTFSTTRKLTKDDLEQTWVVNYVSRFLLVYRLLDLLKKNSPSRIIDVSGTYHSKGNIHFEDLSLKDMYSMANANNQSKLANILFTYKLSRILKTSQVTINTLHPGAVNSGSILRSDDFSVFFKLIYRILSVFFKTSKQGAATSVYLATDETLQKVTGKYFENKKQIPSSEMSYNEKLQDKLWDTSIEWLKDKNYI